MKIKLELQTFSKAKLNLFCEPLNAMAIVKLRNFSLSNMILRKDIPDKHSALVIRNII